MAGFNTEPFVADLRRVVAATWPEVSVVYDAEHVEMIPWETLTLPYAVVLISSLPAVDMGLHAMAFQPVVDVFYVAETRGKAVSLRQKLCQVANAFWPANPLTTARVLQIGEMSWGDELRPNEIFRAGNRNQRAGVVGMECLTGTRKT